MSYNKGTEEGKLRSVFRSLNTQEFAPFVAFLESRQDEICDTLAKGTELPTLYRAQGRLDAIKELLTKIKSNRNFS